MVDNHDVMKLNMNAPFEQSWVGTGSTAWERPAVCFGRAKREKSLRFFVERHHIPGNFDLHWKVLNRGYEARKRDCIRGQIFEVDGSLESTERTDFHGDHIVECAAVQNGVIVARSRIKVPIE